MAPLPYRIAQVTGIVSAALAGGLAVNGTYGGALALAGVSVWLVSRPLKLAPEPVVAATPPLAESPATDAGLLDGILEPAMVIDADLSLLQANNASRRLFGQMTTGEPIDLYFRNPAALEAIRNSITNRQAVEQEVSILAPIEQSYMVTCNPIGSSDGRFLIFLHDITKLKLTDRMRADFVANASHELRTPLATVIGFLETLQGSAGSDKAIRQRFLEIMSKESGRMARLIDDLLSLSRIEMDKHIPPVTPIDLRPLLKDVGSTLAMRLDADSRFIKLDMPEHVPSVFADRDQILQVLHNLMSNALKYGRTGSPISVVVETLPARLQISITDFGEGIAPEHLPRLTERFYRVDTARSRDLGGTGLGLAIVKHIIERHRGELQISSTVGKGTTVAFNLPRADPDRLID